MRMSEHAAPARQQPAAGRHLKPQCGHSKDAMSRSRKCGMFTSIIVVVPCIRKACAFVAAAIQYGFVCVSSCRHVESATLAEPVLAYPTVSWHRMHMDSSFRGSESPSAVLRWMAPAVGRASCFAPDADGSSVLMLRTVAPICLRQDPEVRPTC